jgi:superkiller protein 3
VPRWLPLAVVLLLVSFWGPAAFLRNQVWRSEQLLWEDTLRKEPRRVKAYLRLGLLALDAGDTERGFAYLAKLRNLDARFDYYGFYRARQARVSGDRAGAIALFETVLRRNDDYIEALFEMGELMEETGQYEQAIDYYTRAIDSRQQGEGWALKKDARQRLEALRSRFAPQLAALRRAVAERPDDAAARAELALKLDWLGDYREALDLYQGLERGGVKNWGLFFNMGNIYRKLGRDRDAATHFEQAVQADPGQAQAWNNLGNVRLDLGEREGAITAFQRAIALDSGFAFAQLNLGRAYLDAGRIPEAMEQLTRVRARFPELAPRADAYLQTARQKSGKRG